MCCWTPLEQRSYLGFYIISTRVAGTTRVGHVQAKVLAHLAVSVYSDSGLFETATLHGFDRLTRTVFYLTTSPLSDLSLGERAFTRLGDVFVAYSLLFSVRNVGYLGLLLATLGTGLVVCCGLVSFTTFSLGFVF